MAVKVVLIKRVLQKHQGVLLGHLHPEVHKLRTRQPPLRVLLLLGHLEVQVVGVAALVIPLRGRGVAADEDLPRVPRLLDRSHQQLQRLLRVVHIGRKPALVPHRRAVNPVPLLDQRLQRVVHLRAHPQPLRELRRPQRDQEELLRGEEVARMHPAVDHIEARHRHHHLRAPGHPVEELVQGLPLGRGASATRRHRDPQDGVGAQLGLVRGPVQRQHGLVQGADVGAVHAHHLGPQHRVDVGHGLLHALAQVPRPAVAQLARLVLPRGGPRGHGGPEDPFVGGHLDLHRGVASRVQDLPGKHGLDGGHLTESEERRRAQTRKND
eukprot:RCo054716